VCVENGAEGRGEPDPAPGLEGHRLALEAVVNLLQDVAEEGERQGDRLDRLQVAEVAHGGIDVVEAAELQGAPELGLLLDGHFSRSSRIVKMAL
jgi:hypothetical protein